VEEEKVLIKLLLIGFAFLGWKKLTKKVIKSENFDHSDLGLLLN
jgi:hypothetical protein